MTSTKPTPILLPLDLVLSHLRLCVFPSAHASVWNAVSSILPPNAVGYGVDSEEALAHFLSQASGETGGLTRTEGLAENLCYRKPGLLSKTFPGRFSMQPTRALHRNEADYRFEAKESCSSPMADQKKIKIANHAYSGRYGNGAESTGDGWKYRGKGFFHLTWKDNYLAFQKHLRRSFPKEYGEIDLVSNPDLVSSDIRIGLLSALWYFKTRVVDRMHGGVHAASVERVTLALNPNASTLSDRIATYKRLMLSMPRRIDMPTKSFATDVAFV